MEKFDIIVVGGGHAGLEAAFASAHMGMQTLLITLNIKMMGNMPCNPSIGGSAKGIVVREIDALGGMMGKIADMDYLQMKMLNTGKGVGVQCLRAQEDKIDYPRRMQNSALNTENLTVIEGSVVDLLHDENKVFGVITSDNKQYYGDAVILTTGTYMNSEILIGHTKTSGGPDGEKPSLYLSDNLKKMGIDIYRLKTGTPQRIKADSIDYSKTIPQYGTDGELAFSYETKQFVSQDNQIPCYLIYTNEKTHKIIRDNLDKSAMYGGLVKGVGPRYCPSIEDKIVRFADKERHQLFLEPESRYTDEVYLQGFSTSMPKEVQDEMVRSLPGLENAVILKYAYAIEYDTIEAYEYDSTLQIKKWPGLYIAGQICGTSGYEEAGALGLIAAINAVNKLKGKGPFILGRDEAYIGVMIDDLVSKGTKEPYRLLSSRAEFRLLLRHDNADLRLSQKGYDLGLLPQYRYDSFIAKKELIEKISNVLKTYYIGKKDEFNSYIVSLGYPEVKGGLLASEVLKRQNVYLKDLIKFVPDLVDLEIPNDVIEEVEISLKYEGYINNAKKEATAMAKLDELLLPGDFDYLHCDGLALEARSKLDKIRPNTLGQASRISGVNPSDIAVLVLNIKRGKNNGK